jgi:2-amino-4-hydroxy-6-hydroxymethyldihydropteridine diphosphokinase
MHKITILLGSNQGNRKELILKAIQLLESKLGSFQSASSVYESEAWGFEAETAFLNQVLQFESQLKAQEILHIGLEIEKELGRIRKEEGYSSRTMDIDLLFYDDEIIEEENLQVPHPRLHLRRFTLEPLVEIIPDFIHPKLKKTMRELLEVCPDNIIPKKV